MKVPAFFLLPPNLTLNDCIVDDYLGGLEDPLLAAHHHSPPEPAPMDPSYSFLDPRASSGMPENTAATAAAEDLEKVAGKTAGACTI